MKKLFETILIVVATFVMTLLLNSFLKYYTTNKLEVMLGPKLFINGELYQSIDLTNSSNKTFDELKLSIPQFSNIDSIISSNPISIKTLLNSPNTTMSKCIIISNIKATEMTQLLFPISSLNQSVEIISHDNINVVSFNNVKNAITSAIGDALITSIIYSVFAGLVAYYIFTKSEKLKINADKISKDIDQLKMESEEKIKGVEKNLSRLRALQNLKIIDYQKELSFWRNMIRTLLFDSTKKSFKDADEIIEKITKELKSYSTHEKFTLELDAAMQYASWAKEKE